MTLSRLYVLFSFSFGLAILIFFHLYRLAEVPGLHYDEAWAMNFAWRIASEPGFWPLRAMSPYTAPWAHYWGALWLWLCGPSLLAFRGSQLALSLLGLLFFALALPRHTRAAFVWAVALLPALALNHRFAIELNGLHGLALGVFCCSLRRRWTIPACAAALIGTSAHILFFAVPASLLATLFLERLPITRRERRIACLFFVACAALFLRVSLEVPEKGKALGLSGASLAAAFLLIARAERWRIWGRLRAFLLPGALLFLFNAFFFAQGFWTSATFTGLPVWGDPGPALLLVLGAGGLLGVLLRGWAQPAPWLRSWCLAALLFLGLMMLKPAPRYFELALIALAGIMSFELRRWVFLPLAPLGTRTWLLASCVSLPVWLSGSWALLTPPVERQLRLLGFKDSSRDFLDTQSLARFLGGSGCSPDDIHSADPRIAESLRALALGDWPRSSGLPCRWSFVFRRSDGGVGDPFGEFLLRRK